MTETPTRKFTLAIKSEVVEIDGVNWTVKELTGLERDAWLSKGAGRYTMSDDGKITSINSFDNHQADLIVLALHDQDGKPPLLADVQKWPASVQEDLYNLASELSRLGKYRAKPKNG
jgi:hypothetical protein